MADEEDTGRSADQYRIGGQAGSVGPGAEILIEIVQWTSLAGASGLIGGAASEGVKAAWARMRRRREQETDKETVPLAPLMELRRRFPKHFPEAVLSLHGSPEPHAVERLTDGGWLVQIRPEDHTVFEVRPRPKGAPQ